MTKDDAYFRSGYQTDWFCFDIFTSQTECKYIESFWNLVEMRGLQYLSFSNNSIIIIMMWWRLPSIFLPRAPTLLTFLMRGWGVPVSCTQTFRPIVSSHHFLVRRFAPQLILRKEVSHPPQKWKTFRPRFHSSGRRFALKPYFRKTFRTQTIFQKDVSHPNHISEWIFDPKSYLGKPFRTHFIIRKDVSPPLHILVRRFAP